MPTAKDIKGTALAVITFIVRPFIFLILGLVFGYGLGFSDAFREYDTIGNKVSRLIYRVHPNALSEGVRQRAEVIRDTVHSKTGVIDDIPPN